MHPESQKTLDALHEVAKSGRRIAFVSGNFNVVHPGHLRLLKFAADCGDYLVVGVNSAGASGVVVDEASRLEGVAAIGIVDFAFLLHDPPEQFIAQLRPFVVVKGKEHERDQNPEDRKSTRLNSSHTVISYAVFCLKKKKTVIMALIRRHCRLSCARTSHPSAW